MPLKKTDSKKIKYPYIHPKGRIGYISKDNQFMRAAKEYARRNSLDETMPTGTVIVKSGVILGRGANGSDYHQKFGCERVRLNIPTGQGYELCEGCHPKNHSEPRAVKDALSKNQDLGGASAYLWGHWWLCESCWRTLVSNGITQVYLMNDSQNLFNKESPTNIVGQQWD